MRMHTEQTVAAPARGRHAEQLSVALAHGRPTAQISIAPAQGRHAAQVSVASERMPAEQVHNYENMWLVALAPKAASGASPKAASGYLW